MYIAVRLAVKREKEYVFEPFLQARGKLEEEKEKRETVFLEVNCSSLRKLRETYREHGFSNAEI